ncbi:MAG TPA: hypothetical protein VG122_03885, partial [Gemmata sp.]|nr:hypothetical protein [Gemmata sp.]
LVDHTIHQTRALRCLENKLSDIKLVMPTGNYYVGLAARVPNDARGLGNMPAATVGAATALVF